MVNKEAIKLQVPDNEKFDWKNVDLSGAGQVKKKVNQPKWKWSYDGQLLIWPVDEEYGQPHHIEVTGMKFYTFAQGRVYVDPSNQEIEILVWEDRGTEQTQDEAVEAVDAWLWQHVGREADWVSYQSEGGVYQNLDPENPDKDAMMSAYFGYPVKVKSDGSVEQAHQDLNSEYSDIVGS